MGDNINRIVLANSHLFEKLDNFNIINIDEKITRR